MKYQTLFFCLVLVSTCTAITADAVQESIAGFINGIIDKNDYEEIKECWESDDKLQSLIQEAVKEVEANNFNSIKSGLQKFGKVMGLIPKTLAHCPKIQDDI